MSKTLRQQIEEKILVATNPEEASIEICKFLNDELDLAENGWFDNDEKMTQIILTEDDFA